MSKEDLIKIKGRVVECLPNATFRVELDDVKKTIIATISGKIRKHNINILKHDLVEVELSTYDLTKGRITFRYKG
jgi:translation initiation factor IF-1